jgi:hypothetical protein
MAGIKILVGDFTNISKAFLTTSLRKKCNTKEPRKAYYNEN